MFALIPHNNFHANFSYMTLIVWNPCYLGYRTIIMHDIVDDGIYCRILFICL